MKTSLTVDLQQIFFHANILIVDMILFLNLMSVNVSLALVIIKNNIWKDPFRSGE